MSVNRTQMRREILEIPEAVERLLTQGASGITATAVAARVCTALSHGRRL